MFKVRLIGIHFIKLRSAPVLLRGIFEGYLLVVSSVLVALDFLVKPWSPKLTGCCMNLIQIIILRMCPIT